MNDPILLRRKMREVMAMAPRRRFSERMLIDLLDEVMPESVKLDELSVAIQWNKARDYIESRFNDDRDCDEWFLTDEGKEKQGL